MPSSSRGKVFPLFSLSLLALSSAIAPVSGAPARGVSEVTDVVAIEVPVQVVKDGAPVRGLKASDFEVYDGKQKEALTGFEVLDVGAPPSPPSPAKGAEPVPVAARRHFLFLFDLAYSEPKSIVQARHAVQEVIAKRLQPSDLAAVATYSSKGPQLVLGFTSDRKQIALAVETLGVPELVDRNPDPLRLVAAELKEQPGGVGGKQADSILENMDDLARISEAANRDQRAASVTALTRSYADLAHLLGSVQGRKEVVYLSEGFDSSLILGTQNQQDMDDFHRQAEQAGQNMANLNSDVMYGNTKAAGDVERMLDEFRRADCVVQAVDIGGLRPGGRTSGASRPNGQDALFLMANGTGGELFRNFNDLGEAMNQMLDRTSVTYVLAFQPEGLKRDGTFHKLRIELKNAPRGARVVARPGYYAPRPFAQQNGLERVFAAGNAILSGEAKGAFRLSVLAAPFRPAAADAKAYVPVLLEVDGKGLMGELADGTPGAMPTEVYAYALDEKGGVADYFTQIVGLDLAKVKGTLSQSGVKYFGHLDLPAGAYSLRVLVRNGRTGQSSLRVQPVTVPAFGSTQAVLLPPLFPEPPGKWLMVREAPRGTKKDAPYPFMMEDQPYIPAALPAITPDQATRFALVGYNLSAKLTANAAVRGADGKEMGTSELHLVGREGGGSKGADRLAAMVKPPKLAPGEYVLTVTVTDPEGKSETATTPFLVAGR